MQNHNFRQMILSEKWFIYFFYDIMFMVCHYSLTLSESYKHDIINSSISHVCVWLAHISEWCDGVHEVNSHKIWIRSSQARLVCSFYSYNSSTLMHLIRFCIWVEILPNSVEYIYIYCVHFGVIPDSKFQCSRCTVITAHFELQLNVDSKHESFFSFVGTEIGFIAVIKILKHLQSTTIEIHALRFEFGWNRIH